MIKCNAVKYRTICQQKETCERFLCDTEYPQEYFTTAPFATMPDGTTQCDYYFENKETKNE
jgi:hypothetical protein